MSGNGAGVQECPGRGIFWGMGWDDNDDGGIEVEAAKLMKTLWK